MDTGFLNINKPRGCTSHDVVSLLRKSTGIKKIGHSGTLDPFASGVLVIGINDATRLFEYLPSDKVYLAEIEFGIETDTNDSTGKLLKSEGRIPLTDEISDGLKNFIGKIKQKPPVYSAVNIKGVRAYKLARCGQILEDELCEKEIEIYSIKVTSYIGEKLKVSIHCSSGTYIRSLARDLGRTLNTYATLSSLERVSIGNYFTLEKSIAPLVLNNSNFHEYLISPHLVLELSSLKLTSQEIENISYGRFIKIDNCSENNIHKEIQLVDDNNKLLGIGELLDGNIIKPKKVFIKSGNK